MPSPEADILQGRAVDAILMASGFSVRFGAQNKLLQPFRGIPLAEYALAAACQSNLFGQVFFVYAAPALLPLAQKYSAVPIHNTSPGRGPCESIRLGVSASKADYYLFVQCDQPFVGKHLFARLLALKKPGHIVAPVFEKQQGSPVLFSSRFRQELLSLTDGENARSIKQRHPGSVISCSVASAFSLADIDTPEDFERLEKAAFQPF